MSKAQIEQEIINEISNIVSNTGVILDRSIDANTLPIGNQGFLSSLNGIELTLCLEEKFNCSLGQNVFVSENKSPLSISQVADIIFKEISK